LAPYEQNGLAPSGGAGPFATSGRGARVDLTSATITNLLGLLSRNQLTSLVDCEKRKIALWSGAISAGKTFVSLVAFLIAVRKAPRNGLIVIMGATLGTIYANIFTLLQDPNTFSPLIAAQVKYTEGAKTARILGREVLLVGASDASGVKRIQGSTIALLYVDEAALLPEAVWNMAVSRLRVEGARLLGTMNPASRNHWMRTKWLMKAKAKAVVWFHFTMDDNPALPRWYRRQMEASYSGVFYDRFILGKWTNAAGAIFPMWDPKMHVIPWANMPRLDRVIGVGVDFGMSNATVALMLGLTAERALDGSPRPRLILMDEWAHDSRAESDDGVPTERMAPSVQADRILEWMDTRHIPNQANIAPEYVVLDPSAAPLQEELLRKGLATYQGENEVGPGLATLSSLLAPIGGRPRMIATDRCTTWNSEITEYEWDPKAQTEGRDEPVKVKDHAMDAGRYIAHTARSTYLPALDAAYAVAA
jgi:PBSX family phage terminase large subunit